MRIVILGAFKDEITSITTLSSIEMENMERADPTITGGWFKQQKLYLNNNPNSSILKVKASHSIWMQNPEVVCEQIKKLNNQ